MRMPNRSKFKKNFKIKYNFINKEITSFKPCFGNYYLKCLQNKNLTENQIQNIRIFLKRRSKKLNLF